jgi:hypothetical protein
MAFLTSSNAFLIVKRNNLKGNKFDGEIYKKEIYNFSNYEKVSLLAMQELLKNPEKYFTEVYNPIKIKDSFKYVYPEHQPSYHKNSDCPKLQSNFQNFELPEEIKLRGMVTIIEFRKWFKENAFLLNKPDVFVFRLQTAWKIVINPKSINFDNSGYQDFKNYTLQELEEKIDQLLKEAGSFYYECDKNKTILNRFGKATHLGYNPDPIADNNTNFKDDDVKAFLRDYYERFKLPIKRLLIEYYRVKLNPDLVFAENLLEAIGFKPCLFCHKDF